MDHGSIWEHPLIQTSRSPSNQSTTAAILLRAAPRLLELTFRVTVGHPILTLLPFHNLVPNKLLSPSPRHVISVVKRHFHRNHPSAMTSAFVTLSVPLTTSSFTRSALASVTPRLVVTANRRTARMLGEPPAAQETSEPEEVDEPEIPVMGEATEMVFEVPDESEDEEEGEIPVCPPPQFVVNAENIAATRENFRIHENDSGSPEYQIATLTTRIAYLTTHLKEHPKDHSCTRGLLKLVATRRRLLKYLKGQDVQRFNNIVSGLGIRISAQLREL